MDQLEPFHGDAFAWAVACCEGDRETAADVLQEAYVKVATGRAVFGERSSLKTWWPGVVRFTLLEQLRRGCCWHRVAEGFLDWISTLAPDEDDPGIPVRPGADSITAAMSLLPAREAEVLHLVYQQGLGLSEAAWVMNVSVGSVRQHYDRAKRKLRGLLSQSFTSPVSEHAL